MPIYVACAAIFVFHDLKVYNYRGYEINCSDF
jgi:hypothetical protein